MPGGNRRKTQMFSRKDRRVNHLFVSIQMVVAFVAFAYFVILEKIKGLSQAMTDPRAQGRDA